MSETGQEARKCRETWQPGDTGDSRIQCDVDTIEAPEARAPGKGKGRMSRWFTKRTVLSKQPRKKNAYTSPAKETEEKDETGVKEETEKGALGVGGLPLMATASGMHYEDNAISIGMAETSAVAVASGMHEDNAISIGTAETSVVTVASGMHEDNAISIGMAETSVVAVASEMHEGKNNSIDTQRDICCGSCLGDACRQRHQYQYGRDICCGSCLGDACRR